MNSDSAKYHSGRELKRLRRKRSWSSSSRSPVKKRQRTSHTTLRERKSSSASSRHRSPGKDYSRRLYKCSRDRSRSMSSSSRGFSRRSKHRRRSKSNSQASHSPMIIPRSSKSVSRSLKKASRSPKKESCSPTKKMSSGSMNATSRSPKKENVKRERLVEVKKEEQTHSVGGLQMKLSTIRADNEAKDSESDNDSDDSYDSSSSSSDSSTSSDSSDTSHSEDSSSKKDTKEDIADKPNVRDTQKDVNVSKAVDGAKSIESKGEESGEEDGEIDSNELYTTKAEYHCRKKGHLFCAGFPLTFRSVDLMEFFQDFGAFDAKIVERAGKRFGFVDFISEERAELARFALNGKRPAGEKFPIFVTEKTERGSVSHWVRETETGGARFKKGRRFP